MRITSRAWADMAERSRGAENDAEKVAQWQKISPTMNYDSSKKAETLGSQFADWDAEGILGTRVVDVGCGPMPLSATLLPENPDRKVVQLDVMDTGYDAQGHQYLRYDINKIGNKAAFSTQKTLVKAARHFGVDPNISDVAQADAMIFSEILNYVDYKETLLNFARHLKPGGHFLIFNMPYRHVLGKPDLLHPLGAHSNLALIEFLKTSGFEVDEPLFPWGVEEDTATRPREDFSMMLLKARKK
jgi:SAM-dependent methyltransferase